MSLGAPSLQDAFRTVQAMPDGERGVRPELLGEYVGPSTDTLDPAVPCGPSRALTRAIVGQFPVAQRCLLGWFPEMPRFAGR